MIQRQKLPNIAVEITRGSQQSPEWDEMCARYGIPLSKFKLDQQLCFAAKLNITHIVSRERFVITKVLKTPRKFSLKISFLLELTLYNRFSSQIHKKKRKNNQEGPKCQMEKVKFSLSKLEMK